MKVQGQTTEDNRDSGVLSNPRSFLHSGGFYWNYAGLVNRSGDGNYLSLRSANTTSSNYLAFGSTGLSPQGNGSRGYGFAVRCGSIPPNPSPLSLILAIL